MNYFFRLNLRSEDTSTQPNSEFMKCKHWICRKIKRTVFFMWPASWRTTISSCYYSDINLFLIDYVWFKLCNTWLLLFKNNSRSYHCTGAWHWKKNIVAVITQDKVIEDNLKRQIKNRTLYTCRLFLLTRIFQYISNWLKVFENLFTHSHSSI